MSHKTFNKVRLNNIIYKNECMFQENIYTNTENYCNENTSACSSPKCNRPCCVENMLEILQFCQNLFSTQHIPLFISLQTLHSYINLKSMSTNDDSIQMMSLLSFADQIERLKADIEIGGYFLIRHNKHKHIYFTVQYSNINHNCIHIFFLDDTKSKNYFISDIMYNIIHPYDIYFLKKVKLYDINIHIPANPIKLLNLLYHNDHYVASVGLSPAIRLNNKTNNQLVSNNDYNIYTCYIINDLKNHDRLHRVIGECNKYNLCAKRIDAVMGKTLNRKELIKNGLLVELPNFRKLRMNEIGVFMSHIKCWKEISDLPDDTFHLILEDDIVIRPSFDSIMKSIKDTLKTVEWDIIFLGFNLFNKTSIQKISPYIYKIGFNWGSYSYMITPKTAKLLLQNIFPIQYPIDEVITFGDKQFIECRQAFDCRFTNHIIKLAIMDENHINTWSNGGNYAGVIDPTIGNSITRLLCSSDL